MSTTASEESTKKTEEPPGTSLRTELQALRDAIWRRRPILGEIMQKHGNKILYSYARDFLDVNPTPGLDHRKQELIDAAHAMTERRLGKEVADRMACQLRKYPLVSTTDHHGPIDHPFFVNANLISAIPYGEKADPDLHSLIVFSFASVSVNNASAYPRGILFHGGAGHGGNLSRLPILPDKLKMGVVYATRAFTREDLTKAEAELSKKEKAGAIAPGRGEQIRLLMEEFLGRADVLAAPDLDSQITIINYHLWPRLFHPAVAAQAAPASGPRIPDLLYIEIETLVTDLLLNIHLYDTSTLMHRSLFDSEFRRLGLEAYNNIPGAFSLEKKWGTFFFWAMDEKLHRVRMMLQDGILQSDDGQITVAWNPEAIAEALRSKKLMPSMLLCYLMVSLYYGMKCLGGFSQVNDLTKTKEAWISLLRAMGDHAEAEAVQPVQTKELGGDGMVLPYYAIAHEEFVPATGIDMVLQPGATLFEKYIARSKLVTLSEMMDPMLPEIYGVLYAAPERDQRLISLTPEQILRATGLQRKLVEGFDT